MKNRKAAVLTGASRGSGKAIAIQLAKEGYSIATVGSSEVDRVTDGLEEIITKC